MAGLRPLCRIHIERLATYFDVRLPQLMADEQTKLTAASKSAVHPKAVPVNSARATAIPYRRGIPSPKSWRLRLTAFGAIIGDYHQVPAYLIGATVRIAE